MSLQGHTALMRAALFGHNSIIDLLISFHSDVNQKSEVTVVFIVVNYVFVMKVRATIENC